EQNEQHQYETDRSADTVACACACFVTHEAYLLLQLYVNLCRRLSIGMDVRPMRTKFERPPAMRRPPPEQGSRLPSRLQLRQQLLRAVHLRLAQRAQRPLGERQLLPHPAGALRAAAYPYIAKCQRRALL